MLLDEQEQAPRVAGGFWAGSPSVLHNKRDERTAAADVVAGGSMNGLVAFRNARGQTLKDLEEGER